MRFIRVILINILLVLLLKTSLGQGIPIGSWRVHLPYNKVIAVAEAENRIYAATPYSLFYFDKSDNSLQRFSKVSGLSDVNISAIHYNNQNKTLVIAYSNTNIDLLKNDNIMNIPDIKLKSIPGKKTINNITSKGNTVYLACSFGIVNLNITKNEIEDTYKIGPNGSQLGINDIALTNSNIYAATDAGIYYADISSLWLANYQYWNLDTTINTPQSKFKNIGIINNNLVVCKDKGPTAKDTLYVKKNNNWTSFDTSNVLNFHINYGNLVVSYSGYAGVYNDTLGRYQLIFYPNQKYINPLDGILDKDGFVWIADNSLGLVKTSNNGWSAEFIKPNGPSAKDAYNMRTSANSLFVVPGGINTVSWGGAGEQGVVNVFNNENWTSLDQSYISGLDSISDLTDIAIDPNDDTHFYASSWSTGLLEFNNNKLSAVYNETNSSLQQFYYAGQRYFRVGGACYDQSGNLWVTNSSAPKSLSVKYTNGLWQSFDLSDIITEVSKVYCDKNDYKWMLLRDNKLAVFNTDNNGIHKAVININKGNDLTTNDINCFAEDLDGQIWIGTDQGIKVIYSPETVFNSVTAGVSATTAQTILIQWGNYVQHLLEFESVTAIAVDGANRKWIGTSKAGVFLMSPDGTTQVYNFNTENCPLLSNSINSITIAPNTGEVFFGTDAGIVAYKSTATLGTETQVNPVYAYPNPVRPEYHGMIGIKGLTRDANVKVTDVYGNLVFNMVAFGGQAVWDGKNFSGQRVATGVYLVYCTNADGSETVVTKILFVN